MGVETELFGIKNRGDGKEFRVIERADGNLAVMAGDKVLVDSGVTPVTAVPSGSVVKSGLILSSAGVISQWGARLLPRIDVGDSTVANGWGQDTPTFVFADPLSYYQGGGYVGIVDNSQFEEGNAQLGAPTYLIRNAGIGGNNTDDVLARLDADVLAYKPAVVNVALGTNDIVQGKNAAYIIANLTTIFDRIAAKGAVVVVTDIGPRQSFTAQNIIDALAVNKWLSAQETVRSGYAHVRTWGLLADEITGAPKANYTWDGTHWTNIGAFLIGSAYAKRCAGLFGDGWSFVPNGDSYLLDNTSEVRNDNPLAGAGTPPALNTGVTGTLAQGFDCGRGVGSPNVVASLYAAPDGVGYIQRLAITFAAAGDMVYFGTPGLAARYLGGRLLETQADVAVVAGSQAVLKQMTLSCGVTVTGAVTYSTKVFDQTAGRGAGAIPFGSAGFSRRMRTPRMLMPTGVTSSSWNNRINMYASAAGTVTVDVRQFAARLIVP